VQACGVVFVVAAC